MATALRMSLPLLLLALFSGCWMGERFYGDSELRAPVAPGRYRVIPPRVSDGPTWLSVVIRADGFTWMQPSDSGPGAIGFVPLPERPGYFVAWDVPAVEDGDESRAAGYSLLEVRTNDYRYATPFCPATRGVAEAVGAVFYPDPKMATCVFPNRASLEAAFRQVVSDPNLEWVRLVPVAQAR